MVHDVRGAGLTFCTVCGRSLVAGECAEHGEQQFKNLVAGPRPASAGRGVIGRLVAAGVVLVLAAVATAALVLATMSRTDLEQATRELDAAAEQRRAHTGQLEDLKTALQDAQSRIEQMEISLAQEPDVARTAKRAGRSVFTVISGTSSGSAFVVLGDVSGSSLVTNFHVVAEQYVNGVRTVALEQGDLTYKGEVTRVSEANDLAVIEVAEALPALVIRQARPSVGEPLLVLGSPRRLGGTVTSGIVSAFREVDGMERLQFSAPAAPGSSGGPVIDERGRVIGVTVSGIPGEGLNFAIPAARLCASLDVC